MSERVSLRDAAGVGSEAPGAVLDVNPFSLVEAVNDTSEIAHTGWIIFLSVTAYFCVAVAGVTHKDLLLNSAVQLPVLQVSIDLTRFFLFAPIVLVFLHFGLLVQHVMLARKVLEFDAAVRRMEPDERRTHPIRHELHSYFFTQALAGPERAALFGGFLHGMFWFSIVSLPVLVILFIQVVFLPYHDVTTTWSHRLALVLDVLVIALMGVFLGSRATTFAGAFGRMARYHPLNLLLTGLLFAVVLMFSFLVATVPDEDLDRLTRNWTSTTESQASADGPESRRVFAMTEWVFSSLGSPFKRNLVVTDEPVVDRKTLVPGQVTVSLRDRDLRYAQLDRSDLQQSDLTGSDLTGARLVGTNLRGAKISCTDNEAVLGRFRSRDADCTHLDGADLSRAELEGADLQFAYLNEAILEGAQLEDANLRYASLVGANLSYANLRHASLSGGVELMGAQLLGAKLEGADFKGAKLHLSDFSGAQLQGAQLVFAQALGASFQGADLSGANLSAIRLEGARLDGARLKGVELGPATVWQTVPPSGELIELADMSTIKLEPLADKERGKLTDLIKAVRSRKTRERLEKGFGALLDPAASTAWQQTPELAEWSKLKQLTSGRDPAVYREQLVAYLGELACQAINSDGAVAQGVIRRAIDTASRGSLGPLVKRLQSSQCPAFKHLSEEEMLELVAAAERFAPAASTPAPVPAANPDPTQAVANPG